MGDLFWNKVFGAIGGTLIFVLGVGHISEAIVHAPELEEAAYVINVPEAGAGGAPEVKPEVDLGTVLADANPSTGDTFARTLCGACHTFDEGGATLTGPNLFGVVDRQTASVEGFPYTQAMKDHGGEWTYERLWDYLAAPQQVVPGTAMTFAGLPREDQRANVIAFLGTLSHDPVPFPEPKPPAAEDASADDDADAAAAPEDGAAAADDGDSDEPE